MRSMLVVLVIHDVKPGRLEQARRRIDGNSAQIAQQSGLVFRHTGMAEGADNRIVTVTGWRHADDRRAWDTFKRSLPVEADPRELFDHVQSFTVDIYDERWRPELSSVVEGRQ
jgi:hypothetical protein